MLSWVVSTHEGLVLIYQFIQTPQSVFEGALTTEEEMTIYPLVMTSEAIAWEI